MKVRILQIVFVAFAIQGPAPPEKQRKVDILSGVQTGQHLAGATDYSSTEEKCTDKRTFLDIEDSNMLYI